SVTTNAVFTVTLSPAAALPVTVTFATTGGSATSGADFVASAGTLTFAPGITQKTIVVPIVGDTVTESDETFFVTLSNATNATIATAQGTGTIVNDDVVATEVEGRMFGVGRIDDGRTHHRFVFRASERNTKEYARLE